MVPQQEDACSCGIYILAGILALVHNTTFLDFDAGHVSCYRYDLLRGIIECKLNSPLSDLSLPSCITTCVSNTLRKREAEIALVEHPQKRLKAGG